MEGTNPISNNPNNSTDQNAHHVINDFGQKTIRTYESDIAEAIEHKKASQVSINLAEIERQHTQEMQVPTQADTEDAGPKGSVGKNILKILLSLILAAAGGLGGYYLYTLSPLSVQPTIVEQAAALYPAIITPDRQTTLNIQGENASQILGQIKNQSTKGLNQGQITELILYEQGSSGNTKITGPEFISKINLAMPDVLSRSLTDSWMIGFYQGTDGAQPFIILTTSFFQNAFSGMLGWEPTMADDISKVFSFAAETPLSVDAPAATTLASSSDNSADMASSTPTNTPPPTSYFGIRGKFIDKVVHNKDVREFQDQSGNILFIYAFIDNNTLVIAQEESALNEIITRFEKQAYVR